MLACLAIAVLSGCGEDPLPSEPETGIRKAPGTSPVLGVAEPNAWRRTPLAATPDSIAGSVASLGARSQRFVVDWRLVEPRPPDEQGRDYLFAPFDAMYRSDLRHGVRPLLVILNAPGWTWDDGALSSPFANNPPAEDHLGDWRAFLGAVARRYPGALGVEIWNEPNLTTFWGAGSPTVPPDPVRYARLLQAAYAAVKSVNPSLLVVGGALASNQVGSRPGDFPMVEFAEGMLAAGAAAHMDALSVHPYPGSGGAGQTLALVDQLLRARDEAGARTPIWVTEVGVSTTGAMPVSDVEQARQLLAICQGLAREPSVEAVYIHNLIEQRGTPASAEPGYGLLKLLANGGLRPKPAAGAVRAAFGAPRGCASGA